MRGITEIIAILALFGMIPGAIVWFLNSRHKAKHKERLAMIEKGVDLSSFIKEVNPLFQILMWGSLLAGIGLGLLLGYLLSMVSSFQQEAIMPILAILFGGTGLIIFYIYRKRSEKRESK